MTLLYCNVSDSDPLFSNFFFHQTTNDVPAVRKIIATYLFSSIAAAAAVVESKTTR